MIERPHVAVTGGFGTMGTALREFLPNATYLTRAAANVCEPDALFAALDRAAPDVVLHAAALTDHQHPNAAEIIETNIRGTARVAWWCRANGVKLVYLSTHYVYPGVRGDYREWDTPSPIGAYAASKLAGEDWAREAPNALVIRGSWYTLRRVAQWARVGVLTDAFTNREPVADAARKIAALIQADERGIFNIGGARRTFYDIAVETFGDGGVRSATRASLSASVPYAFPADSSVSTAKFGALGLAL